MNLLLILLIVAAMGLTLFSLVRGLIHFARTSDAVREGVPAQDMYLAQNRMMFARIKWQAIAILLLVALMAIASN